MLEPLPGYPILKVTMPRSGADYITAELKAQNVVSVGGLQVGSVHATQAAAIGAALASVPTSTPTSDPCEFANDGTCDVPRYCKEGDYADCLAGAPGLLGLLRSSPSCVVPWLPWVARAFHVPTPHGPFASLRCATPGRPQLCRQVLRRALRW